MEIEGKKKMKRLFSVVCVFFMLIVMCGCTNATNVETNDEPTNNDTQEKMVYRIGMECDYAPNNWQEDTASDTNLPISNLDGFYAEGYDIQMSKLIAEELDCEIEIVKLAWSGLIQALKEGQIDMIIAGMGDTPERKESIAFSNTYSTKKTEYVLVVRSDSEYVNATSIQDFSGATVVGQVNTYYDSAIDQIEGVNHAPAAVDVPNMTSKLQEGLVDAIVLDDETADAMYADDSDYTVLAFEGDNGFVVEMTGACVGIRLEDTDLVEQVNTALANISKETRVQLMEEAKARQPK